METETSEDEHTANPESAETLGLLWVHPKTAFTPLTSGVLSLGRGAGMSVELDFGSVSRHHASIRRQGPLHVVTDAGSRNGTRVNGRLIDEAPLSDQDVLRLGDAIAVVVRLRASLLQGDFFDEPVPGVVAGPRTRLLWNRIPSLARSDASILIEGPTGTGKEVLASALHGASGRRGAFVAQNCAALPEGLAEALLFGHARGAFTGAQGAAPGLFVAADGGTLLLDEVLDLPLAQQAKLLRILEDGLVTPLGQTRPRRVDVRVITTAHAPLAGAVAAGKFRADLFARLAGVTLRLPALAERREEIPGLFARFLRDARVDPQRLRASFVEALCLSDWPLNVRELRQVAKALATTFASDQVLGRSHLEQVMTHFSALSPRTPAPTAGLPATEPSPRRAAWLARHSDELKRLRLALAQFKGNVSLAARSVGISRQQAQRLLVADTPQDVKTKAGGSPDESS